MNGALVWTISVLIVMGGCTIKKYVNHDLENQRRHRLAERVEELRNLVEEGRKDRVAKEVVAGNAISTGRADLRELDADAERKVEEFALRELPSAWMVYRELEAEIKVYAYSLKDAEKAFAKFGMEIGRNENYAEAKLVYEAMKLASEKIRRKIVDAYIAHKKFETTPGAEYYSLRDGVAKEIIDEAEGVRQKYARLLNGNVK